MKLYKTKRGIILENGDRFFRCDEDWDRLVNREGLFQYLSGICEGSAPVDDAASILRDGLLPPVGKQEIWAAGVTYYRSRTARMEESKDSGGGDFYDRVYGADRPELFFKSTAGRARGHGENVRIRRDSKWSVPEPELTLLINANGKIAGYTIGNDMSSRDIEGENPLYLPQAKTYDGSAAIGPCVYVSDQPVPEDACINIEIRRNGAQVFSGETTISQIKRKFTDLVSYLFREMSFPHGVLLMTGTGVIPPDDFTLHSGDEIRIGVDFVGSLVNRVE